MMEHMTRTLRILFVTARYLPHVGGTEIHTYEVARRLVQAGHSVTVLTTDLSGQLPRQEVVAGIQIVRVQAWPKQRDYYFAPGIYRYIQRGKWDILHCQGYHTLVAPLALLAARRAGIPTVVTFHSGGHSSAWRLRLRPIQHKILRPLLAHAQHLISVSQWEETFFKKCLNLPSQHFSVIPNGSYLPAPTACKGADSAESVLLSVGRLERYKGHHLVIAALPLILEKCPQVRLRIVGTGPYEATLRQMAIVHGVSDKVEIRGIAGGRREEMANVLQGAALVILLSNYESQGMAVMEAVSLERPVLVADGTALRELAENQFVRALPLGNSAESTATAIINELDNPHVPPRLNLPTWDGCYRQLIGLYRTILEQEHVREVRLFSKV